MSASSSCRILTVSSTSEQARTFVGRIKALCNDSSEIPEEGPISWTISNRYYTADVHFETLAFENWSPYHAEGVPAVIFVWAQGEPYKDHVPLIAKELAEHEPEVSLAVRIGGGASASAEDADDGVDEFIAGHGFEFIDGESNWSRSADDGLADHGDSGIPGLPRVVDALSTIMWPSMVQSQATQSRKTRTQDLLDWAGREEEEDGLQSLMSDQGPDDQQSRVSKEMEDLAQWLEEDNPWSHGNSSSAVPTPTGSSSWPSHPVETDVSLGDNADEFQSGFDDDFTAFVSVSAPADFDSPELSDESMGFVGERLAPMHTGASYRSLASDFGEGGDESPDGPHWDDNGEEDLPSQAEIEATSRRIFRSISPSINPNQADINSSAGTLAGLASSSALRADADADYEMSNFDLSRVMGALQVMKEEIAGMEDEGERRKAAARVALGLVYGLEAEKANDPETEAETQIEMKEETTTETHTETREAH